MLRLESLFFSCCRIKLLDHSEKLVSFVPTHCAAFWPLAFVAATANNDWHSSFLECTDRSRACECHQNTPHYHLDQSARKIQVTKLLENSLPSRKPF